LDPCASTSRRRCARGPLVAWAQSAQRRTRRSRAVAPPAAGPRDARPGESPRSPVGRDPRCRTAPSASLGDGLHGGPLLAPAGVHGHVGVGTRRLLRRLLLPGVGRRDPTALLVTSCHARPGGADAELPPLARAVTLVQAGPRAECRHLQPGVAPDRRLDLAAGRAARSRLKQQRAGLSDAWRPECRVAWRLAVLIRVVGDVRREGEGPDRAAS